MKNKKTKKTITVPTKMKVKNLSKSGMPTLPATYKIVNMEDATENGTAPVTEYSQEYKMAMDIAEVVSSTIAFANIGTLLGRITLAVPKVYPINNAARKKALDGILDVTKRVIALRNTMVPAAGRYVAKQKPLIGAATARRVRIVEEVERELA